jgi:hypothetical protein
MITQGAANVYLSVAEQGGELELWPYGLTDQAQYEDFQTPGDYGLDRCKIGPSVLRSKPEQGDLIIFDARKIHAVNRNDRGLRITASAFIGYRGQGNPLTVYS